MPSDRQFSASTLFRHWQQGARGSEKTRTASAPRPSNGWIPCLQTPSSAASREPSYREESASTRHGILRPGDHLRRRRQKHSCRFSVHIFGTRKTSWVMHQGCDDGRRHSGSEAVPRCGILWNEIPRILGQLEYFAVGDALIAEKDSAGFRICHNDFEIH